MKTIQNICFASCLLCINIATAQVVITGEPMTWHNITLTLDGPDSDERANPNPFTDYRLVVTFSQGTQSYVVPGYFAADGNAANSSATGGNRWRVHFAPSSPGEWKYSISFREGGSGSNIAVSDAANVGRAALHDGETGVFTVQATNKTGQDLRRRGRLEYVGERYLKFAGSGEYFLKVGADAPENLLAYADFDGDFKTDGKKDDLVKNWRPHVGDWRDGDPSWQTGKGKGLIGAINYLADKGMNAISFLTMNIGGDDKNVFPYVTPNETKRFDVSRLDQWEIVFSHAERKGMFLHFKTQETENETLLDGGDTGIERKLYYRELIARFGHHLALNWNLGEENGAWAKKKNFQTTEQRVAMANYFAEHDPYRHSIVIHNGQWYDDLFGDKSQLTGASLQTNKPDFSRVHGQVLKLIRSSAAAGKPWVVACDEPGDAQHALLPDKDNPTHDNARMNALWGTLMAGGQGVEWYFGYAHDHSDLTCQDWRSRDAMWDQSRFALDFFTENKIPFWKMASDDQRLSGRDGYCFAEPRRHLIAYVKPDKSKTAAALDLGAFSDRFSVRWYDPRQGGSLQEGSIAHVTGPGRQSIGLPPTDSDKDWVAWLELDEQGKAVSIAKPKSSTIMVEAEDFVSQSMGTRRSWYLTSQDSRPEIDEDGDPPHLDGASGGAYLEILPDTRRTHDDKLIPDVNFSNKPGKHAIIDYKVNVPEVGRYYIWVRAFSTGSEDNGLHVGLNGTWPESGQRMQWCDGKNQWWWESKQRTQKEHCGVPHAIYLDISDPGEHTISFSMREDGFEFDKWLMTTDRDFQRPE